MRIYFDTEFTHLEGNAKRELISAGFVSEDGREWYAEISDFNRALCSVFVVSTVLPLLEGKAETTIAVAMFGPRLSAWLTSFGEDVELIADHSADWELVVRYTSEHLAAQPYQIQSTVWQPPNDESQRIKILEAELRSGLPIPASSTMPCLMLGDSKRWSNGNRFERLNLHERWPQVTTAQAEKYRSPDLPSLS